MASVTQCDACGNIVKHENSKRVRIYDIDKSENLCERFLKIDRGE